MYLDLWQIFSRCEMSDLGVDPDVDKGCNSVLKKAEPLKDGSGWINRTNGSYLRKGSVLLHAYPRTPFTGYLPTKGYFAKPDGEDCLNKLAYPASIAFCGSLTTQVLVGFQDVPAHIRKTNLWMNYRIPFVMYATVFGAGVGATTCMLSNIPPFKKHPNGAYFTSGFSAGMLWGLLVAKRRPNIGSGFVNGLLIGLSWVAIKEAWRLGLPGLFPLDPMGDLDFQVNHIPRPA